PGGCAALDPAWRNSAEPSSTIAPRLMSRGIDALLEGIDADALDGVDEPLVFFPDLEVGLDQARNDIGHVVRRERGADHLAERRALALRTADRDLVPLGTVLVDAKHADMADVVVAARVHASGNVEIELADVVQIIQIVE